MKFELWLSDFHKIWSNFFLRFWGNREIQHRSQLVSIDWVLNIKCYRFSPCLMYFFIALWLNGKSTFFGNNSRRRRTVMSVKGYESMFYRKFIVDNIVCLRILRFLCTGFRESLDRCETFKDYWVGIFCLSSFFEFLNCFVVEIFFLWYGFERALTICRRFSGGR